MATNAITFCHLLEKSGNMKTNHTTEIAQREFKQSAACYLEELCSNQQLLKDLLKAHLIETGRSEQWIGYVLSQITICIKTHHKDTHTQLDKQAKGIRAPHTGFDHYSIDGDGTYGVGRLALHIVRHIMETHPQMPFSTIQQVTYTGRTNVKSLVDIEHWRQSGHDTHNRWFEKEPLLSGDGIPFAVSTQWTRDNILPLIEIGRKYGLEIKKN